MTTKKAIKELGDYALSCFKKMMRDGGHYFERQDKELTIITFRFYNKVSVAIPMEQAELTYWKSIKPSIRKGDVVKEK